MSIVIETYFQNALLSMAAYANLTTNMSRLQYVDALVHAGFTQALAETFADTYTIASVSPASPNGFYAVVFQETAAHADGSHDKTLAIRGTELSSLADLITDANLATFGDVSEQYDSLQAYYLQLRDELTVMPGEQLAVTGHSLGGFLAEAFTVDHATSISHTYTYNAPGVGGVLIDLLQAVGVVGQTVPTDLITNLIATGPSFTASLGSQLGNPENIFIETSSFSPNDHSIERLVDSLALYDVFGTIDRTLDDRLSDIKALLDASSSNPATSLENALDALRKLYQGPSVLPTPTDNRDSYFTNLNALKAFLSPTGLLVAGQQVFSLANLSGSSLATLAAQDIAYRYALNELNPFVVLGANYTTFNSGHALDLYNAQTGQGTWTTLALQDRGELLAAKSLVNVNDGALFGSLASDTHYLDVQSGFEFGTTLTATNDVIFGDDRVDEIISGREGDDHLYGRGGADTIQGNGGRDYIEGGTGNDVLLSGGAGDDIILGEDGNDTLDGGSDNDRLNGGLGNDTLSGGAGTDQYTYFSGQGSDTIVDSDKSGSILFDGQTLVGGIRRQGAPADTWQSVDGQFTFVKAGTSLIINHAITIDNFDFTTGELGVKLADAGNLVDSAGPVINYVNGQPTVTYDGDATDNIPIFTAAANHIAHGFGGNDILNLGSSSALFNHQIFGGDGHDELDGGKGNDRIYGEAGRDEVTGAEGDDVLDGGGDIDVLKGGLGQDVLYGGAGDDGVDGGSGDDVLWGGDGNDVLSGESGELGATTTGNDYLDGEAGDDWVLGLLGDDVLYGGSGADKLYGDQYPSAAPNLKLTYPGIVEYVSNPGFASFSGGADYLDGGIGNDYVQGDGGNDILLGGDGDDQLWGDDTNINAVQEGDDWLEGGAGNDQLVGGGGEDALFGGDGADILVGDYANNPSLGFDDTLDGGAGNDQLQGGGGNDLLDGGSENDLLFGDDGDDSLYGGTGDDQLQGGAGDDVLSGEDGTDVLFGQAGDDLLFGDDGNDQLSGNAGFDQLAGGLGDDVLFGGDDDDTLLGDEGNDELQGGAGDDLLVGDVGNDRVFGDAGNDSLFGDEGDDRLSGDAGDDRLNGGDGNDTYVFNLGDGHDVIVDEAVANAGNVIQFGAGITLADLLFVQDETNQTLTIQVGGTSDTIQLDDFSLTSWSPVVETLLFSNGSAAFLTDLLPTPSGPIQGTNGSNTIHTGAGNDEIHAGAGDDAVAAGAGDDLLFGDSGDDSLDGADGNDQLFGGSGDDALYGGDGNDQLYGGNGNDLLNAGAGDDLLVGGAGNDNLLGGTGQDTYQFNAGDGSDSITDSNGEGNRLIFGSGISLSDLSLEVGVAGSLIIHTGTTNDQIQITNFNPLTLGGTHPIDSFEFADGTVLNYPDLAQRGFTFRASQAQGTSLNGSGVNDLFFGGPFNDTFDGRGGNDQAFGGGGNDKLIGSEGDDLLDGSSGDDELFGGSGSDTLIGGDGNDYMVGNGANSSADGNDVFDGGAGNDFLGDVEGSNTFIFRHGYGRDVVQSYDGYGSDIDTLLLPDILPSEITVQQYNGVNTYPLRFGDMDSDLELLVNGGSSDSILINEWVQWQDTAFQYDPLFQVERIQFADGTVWSTADLLAHAQGVTRVGTEFDDQGFGRRLDGTQFNDVLIGLGGDDELTGFKGDDLLDGGSGDDYLQGDTGNDTYVFGRGYGSDWIYEDLYDNESNLDVIRLNADVTPADVTLQADQDDNLVLRIAGTSDSLTINRFLWDTRYEVEQIAFADGTIWDSAAIRARMTGVDIVGTESNDVLTGTSLNDTLTGLGGADVLDGRGGVNQLIGGLGDDTYLFNRDGGIDIIQDSATAGEPNHLKFDFGTSASDLVVTQGAGTLVLTLDGTTDRVQLAGFDPTGAAGSLVIGSLDFSRGFTIDTAKLLAGQYTDGADLITGTAGNDLLAGRAGNDDLAGGMGDDILIGGTGDDVYRFNVGDGVDAIDDRTTEHNRLIFGAGITADELRAQVQGNILTLRVGDTGDAVKIAGFFGPTSPLGVEEFNFADGTVLTDGQLLATKSFEFLGTDANDTIGGTTFSDRLIGGKGDDFLAGSLGADTYVFNIGDGRDTIADSNFSNITTESNTIEFGPGIASPDLTFLRDGSNLLIRVGTNGDALSLQNFGFGFRTVQTLKFADGVSIDITNILNTPIGTTANETINGTSGNDTIISGGGNDTLNGGLGNDTLVGGTGTTVFNGGPGNDFLVAGNEGNTFIFSIGSGRDTIQVPNYLIAATANNIVQFAGGYDTYHPSLSYGSLVVRYGNVGDEIRIVDFDPNDVFAKPAIQRFVFTDRVVTYDQLIALGFDITGTNANDVLTGTNTTDRFLGLAGDDQISGGAGTDTLTGGVGNDSLRGGAGNDVYVFNIGDGIDTIEDSATPGEANRIQFGAGIVSSALTYVRDTAARMLTIQVGTSGTDQLRLNNFDPSGINGSLVVQTLAFADGTSLNLADLFPPNQAPTVSNPLVNQTVLEDAPFSIQVPANAFSDPDAGDTLTYSAAQADGSALPSWLSFDATTRTFTGIPDDAQVGTLNLAVKATDAGGLSATSSFVLTVENVNEVPSVPNPLTDQTVLEDAPFSIQVPLNTFADPDTGDTLTYSATQADGNALPTWLSFNAATRTFTGTPDDAQVGTLNLAVKATDAGGLSATSAFALTVQNVNEAPTVAVPLPDQQATQGTGYNLVVPTTTFADVDPGDALTYTATLASGAALPTWLNFNATTRTFTGTPQAGDVGTINVRVTATDSGSLSAADVFALTIAPSGGTAGNDTLVGTSANDLLDGLGGDDVLQGLAGNDTLLGGTGNDVLDGGQGADQMTGGPGNDTYVVDTTGDVVTENVNEGTDTVQSSITYTLGANVENLTLTGTGAINGTGNALNNVLTGNSAANVLTGGAGNDTYYIGAGDTVVEQANQGTDTVITDQTYTLGANLENLTLAGTANLNGTGNTLSNVLTGNSGNNVLDGGTGADTLMGGLGNDTYVVDNVGDAVTENANQGTDTVQSSLTYTLGANLENLTLSGTTAINGTGNALDNVLTGNSGNNTLTGGAGNDRLDGGAGSDTMIGGAGNDTYVVNQAGDVVTENANEGTDTVESSIAYTLGANLENLTFTGTANLAGTGNSLNNVMLGNSGANALDGGIGNDTLDGGAGNDTLQGGIGDDTVFGGVGDDVLNGGTGNDVLDGGDGIDTLDGGSENDILRGGAGNDTIGGGSGADQLTGGTGNDTLNGGGGNDLYNFVRGDGQDTISDADTTARNQDKLLFGTTINPLDLVLSRQVNDLRIAIHGTTDQVTIKNWYTSPTTNQIEDLQAGNGQHLLNTQVNQLIQAMAAFSQQTGLTWDQAIDARPQDVQNVLAASWH